MGIGPTFLAWEASILPLYYIRIEPFLIPAAGFTPAASARFPCLRPVFRPNSTSDLCRQHLCFGYMYTPLTSYVICFTPRRKAADRI